MLFLEIVDFSWYADLASSLNSSENLYKTISYILPPYMSLSTSCGTFVVSTTGDNIRRWLFCKVLWFVSGSLCSDFAIKWNSPQIEFSASCFTLTSSTLRVWISLDTLEFRSRRYSVRALSFDFDLFWPMPWFCQKSNSKYDWMHFLHYWYNNMLKSKSIYLP